MSDPKLKHKIQSNLTNPARRAGTNVQQRLVVVVAIGKIQVFESVAIFIVRNG